MLWGVKEKSPPFEECPSRYSQVSIRAKTLRKETKKQNKTLRKEIKEIGEFANDA